MTISPAYAEQNRALHASDPLYGATGWQWAAYVDHLIEQEEHHSVLDFGCGKSRLLRALMEIWEGGGVAPVSMAEYDPAIPGKDAEPASADLVVCTDVLEHVEPHHLDDVLASLATLTRRKLLFDICLIPAKKHLADNRNAHLIVQPPDWWRFKLSQYFDITRWVEREGYSLLYGEAVPKGAAKGNLRCRMTFELSETLINIRMQSAAHCDAFSQIKSIRLFTGHRDRPADMQVIYDLLEDAEDPEPVFQSVVRIARKGVMAWVKSTPERGETYWRDLFARYWRVADCREEHGVICMVGSPKVTVEGIKPQGAMESDERWEQVLTAMARVKKRIETAAPHGRKAILVCYGPSLRDNITRLKDELAEGLADVVSVSGAHDFLIENGVTPDYHVECDPRPHKADNIDRGYDGVKYLIGSVAHPKLFDKLEGLDVALWHVATQEHAANMLRMGEKGHHIITGGGSVGLRAIPLLYAMGYRDFSVYGMDCSFADEGKLQWAGKHAGKRHHVLIMHSGGRQFATSPILLTYATDFIEMVQKVGDAQFRLYGDGLLQTMCVLHAQLAMKAAA